MVEVIHSASLLSGPDDAVPAGSVAERFNFNAYLGYSIFIAGFVYPVVAHVSKRAILGANHVKP
jgi:hypothetical protein